MPARPPRRFCRRRRRIPVCSEWFFLSRRHRIAVLGLMNEGDAHLNDRSRKEPRQPLVQMAADRLRKMVLANPPGTQIGGLRDLAAELGVGVVTVQQVARVLEHEGLLVARRGPGGGYYGARPDDASLERAFAAWLSVHGSGNHEILEMRTLLETELIVGAASSTDDRLFDEMKGLAAKIDKCDTPELRIEFEGQLNDLMFRMTKRPLVELLSRVTLRHYSMQAIPALFPGEDGLKAWKSGRRRILDAIMRRDEELARFEADRHRNDTLRRLRLSLAKMQY
jgi:GntR family transcriptional repressor for pyruvate dehydrogenase complex